QCLCSWARTGHIVQFCALPPLVERTGIWKQMQHGSHPPGETLHFPHPAQTNLRVTIEQVAFAIAVELGQRLRQHSYIGYRKIESLRSGRRDNMGGIPSQKKFSILHRFDDEAAHASDPFLD